MEKKVQKNSARNPKPLKLNKVTIHLLDSSDLAHVAGGESRSLCAGTAECCNFW
jgi:hypothetical protein